MLVLPQQPYWLLAGTLLLTTPQLGGAWKFNSSDWTTVAVSMTPANQAPGPDGTIRFEPDSGGHPTVSVIGAISAVFMVVALFLLVLLAWLDGRRRRRALERQRRNDGLEGGIVGGQQGAAQERALAMRPMFLPVVVLSPNNEVDLARRLSSDGGFAKEKEQTLSGGSRKAAAAAQCTGEAQRPAAHTVGNLPGVLKWNHEDSTVEAARRTTSSCLGAPLSSSLQEQGQVHPERGPAEQRGTLHADQGRTGHIVEPA